MSRTTDKTKGTANDAAGAIKKGVGKATGQESLEAEGIANRLRARHRRSLAKPRTSS
jgi:uncharacterized protein YjbJ (UPF0337 family)